MHGKWNSERIKKEGVIKKLSTETPMQRNLAKAYYDYYGKETAISFKTLEYFDMISYTVIQDNDAKVDVTIHIGDTIDVEEDNEIASRAYAIIRGIFTHTANDKKKYAFFILDWYYYTGRIDNFTRSKIYGLQEFNDESWPHIHSFHIVDRKPRVHFVHNCKKNCANGHHATDNLEYLHNEFFYVAV